MRNNVTTKEQETYKINGFCLEKELPTLSFLVLAKE